MCKKFLGALWHVYLTMFFSTTSLFASTANVAMVDAQICASATIISKDPGLDVSGFPEKCAWVSGSAVASLPFDDSLTIDLAAGGVNLTNNDLSYTIQYDWSWSITTSVSGPNETASAEVLFSLWPGFKYTTGSGSDSRQFTETVPGRTTIDWFGEIKAKGYASVPEPGALWLTISGLIGWLSVKKSIKNS